MPASTPKKPLVRQRLPNACSGPNRWGRFRRTAQPSPAIAQCLNGGYGWLEVMRSAVRRALVFRLMPSAGHGAKGATSNRR